jgi:hypothetical protein
LGVFFIGRRVKIAGCCDRRRRYYSGPAIGSARDSEARIALGDDRNPSENTRPAKLSTPERVDT